MTSTIVDTNVLIDMLGPSSVVRNWSRDALKACAAQGELILNPVIWSELGASPLTEAEATAAFSWVGMKRETITFEAAFVAGKAHVRYRRSGGLRERTLPDFLIGAQAAVRGHRLLTRDPERYRAYFPTVELISPDTHPIAGPAS